jgi:hypothetical protein
VGDRGEEEKKENPRKPENTVFATLHSNMRTKTFTITHIYPFIMPFGVAFI